MGKPSNETRQLIRVAKGRPAVRTLYQQNVYRDGALVRVLQNVVAPDPMLDLYALRAAVLRFPSPAISLRYGELLQKIVSPSDLPRDLAPAPALRVAA